jgi:serine/threonine-protein kinase
VVGKGALTLIVQPEATVYLGGKLLGKTPLFSTPVPAGTHLMKLVGPDGRKRVLSVPIQAGKTAAFRLSLDELPEE